MSLGRWMSAVVFMLVPVRLLCGQNQAWHLPVLPAGCPNPVIEVELLDSGRTMASNGAFAQAQREATNRIEELAPNCTLEIVASFAATAEVRGAAILVDDASRQFLAGKVMGLTPSRRASNNAVAARLIGSLNDQLHSAYGAAADRLVVRVYSDFDHPSSAAGVGASPGLLLARQMNARYVGRAELEKGTVTTLPAAVSEGAAAKAMVPPTAAEKRRFPWRCAVAGALGVLLAGALFFRRRCLRGQATAPKRGELVALMVNATLHSNPGAAAVTSGDRRIEVAVGVPVVFSTDAASATYVAAEVKNGPNGELFRIEPLSDGTLRIRSVHPSLTVDGEPLYGERRVQIDGGRSLRLRLAEREYGVCGIFGRQPAKVRDDLFEAEALHL